MVEKFDYTNLISTFAAKNARNKDNIKLRLSYCNDR